MKWLEEITEKLGEPRIKVPDETRLGDGIRRRCWVWFPNNVNHSVKIDRQHGRYTYTAQAHSGGRDVEVTQATEPTDDEMRAVLRLAWPRVFDADQSGVLPGGAQ